jgi:hypothetical protein
MLRPIRSASSISALPAALRGAASRALALDVVVLPRAHSFPPLYWRVPW